MTLSTSTRIAPIVDVSTYYGPFGYESLWGADEESEWEEGCIVCDDYDFSKMSDRIVKEANTVFETEEPLKEYGVVSIKATKFGSPREYNFMTDWLDLDVEVDDTFWTKAKEAIFDPKNRAKIVEYAGRHWVSRDGFSSAMLNRICTLSRDHWKHEHYRTHMATDEEVEDALLADLEDAFKGLSSETSEDEFREFGAILALLWLIDYPCDFDQKNCDDVPLYGSWVTDEMVESIRFNSSLSDFCTVLTKEDVKKRFGEHMIDFDERRKMLAQEINQYKLVAPDRSRAERLCEIYMGKVERVFKELENRQLDIMKNGVTCGEPNERDKWVNDMLDAFREDAEEEMYSATDRAWREASQEAR